MNQPHGNQVHNNQVHGNQPHNPAVSKPEMFRSPLPYPKIKIKEKNRFFAREILSNVGGKVSEMSAVALYFYSHLLTKSHPKIAEAFHHISITEMKHLEIFGELSLALGADPRLWSRANLGMKYWNAGFANYPCGNDVKVILNVSLKSELEAIEKYTHQMRIIKNENIREILGRIIEDEKLHVVIFKKFLSEL